MNSGLSSTWIIIIVILAIWELIWKGIALWNSAKKRQLYWFLAILIINSVGIIPIIYLVLEQNKDKKSKQKKN
ncbi:MAG TPA: DUF5652 family protein [Patescibacteria group bacterium]|nr:DUF5652 family protein [Patescibacteria group bacterium]